MVSPGTPRTTPRGRADAHGGAQRRPPPPPACAGGPPRSASRGGALPSAEGWLQVPGRLDGAGGRGGHVRRPGDAVRPPAALAAGRAGCCTPAPIPPRATRAAAPPRRCRPAPRGARSASGVLSRRGRLRRRGRPASRFAQSISAAVAPNEAAARGCRSGVRPRRVPPTSERVSAAASARAAVRLASRRRGTRYGEEDPAGRAQRLRYGARAAAPSPPTAPGGVRRRPQPRQQRAFGQQVADLPGIEAACRAGARAAGDRQMAARAGRMARQLIRTDRSGPSARRHLAVHRAAAAPQRRPAAVSGAGERELPTASAHDRRCARTANRAKAVPGWVQADTVRHSGPSSEGGYACTLTCVDEATGWIALRALPRPGGYEVASALESMHRTWPVPMAHLHTDNGAEFVNRYVQLRAERNNVGRSRGRPHCPTGQARVEERNGRREASAAALREAHDPVRPPAGIGGAGRGRQVPARCPPRDARPRRAERARRSRAVHPRTPRSVAARASALRGGSAHSHGHI